jgi:tetratricopeptide (TPR) repeat protein/tRNA A-37 threonylcarbamoyl transferase component Bud32
MASKHLEVEDREEQLGEVLAACLEAVENGVALDRPTLLARHPEFAEELGRFFARHDRLNRLAAPLRQAVRAEAETDDPERTDTDRGSPVRGPELCSFGDYELLAEIAQGGMGVVYRARQKSLNRLVALKMIRDGELASPADVQRFRNEAEAVAHLDHPHIVPIYEVGDQDRQYFSMKLIEGSSLAAQLERFRADPRAAARLVVLVARAVHHAHQRGILHRDLKPSNILLDEQGQPHVTDFGLARRIEGDSSLTQSGALVGTPSYMAPEQTLGQRGAVTTAADVHGLGAVLYALLTGRPPFQAETPLDTLLQVREREPEPPSRSNPRVDRDLEAVCLKCLEKQPQSRYASAEALAEELERWLAGEPIQARAIGRAGRVWRWCRRNPWPAGLLLLSSLTAAGATAGAVLIWQQKEAKDKALEAREEARARAEARTAFAREAAEDMYTQVAEKWLADQPHMTEVQRQFLRKALHIFQVLARERSDDPAVQMETGKAASRVGGIHEKLGDLKLAVAAYRQAIELLEPLEKESVEAHVCLAGLLMRQGRYEEAKQLFRTALLRSEKLAAAHPGPRYWALLAMSRAHWAGYLTETRNYPEAVKMYRDALEIRRSVAATFPKDAWSWGNLGYVSTQYGNLLGLMGHHREALAAHQEALTSYQRLQALSPGTAADYSVASAHNNMGITLAATRQRSAAAEHYRQALPILEQLAGNFPAVPRYRHDLARTSYNLANVLEQGGERPAAEAAHRRACDLLEKLARDFRGVAEHHDLLGAALNNLAVLVLGRGDAVTARRLLEQAISHRQAALKIQPGNATSRQYLQTHYRSLATALIELGEHATAARTVAECLREFPLPWPVHLNEHYRLARCARLAEKDEQLPAAERTRLARAYTDQARQLLREAARGHSGDHKEHDFLAWVLTTHPDPVIRDAVVGLEFARRAVELKPDNGDYRSTLGVALYRAGDWRLAIAAFSKARGLRKTQLTSDLFFMAMAHWQLGDKEKARQCYDRVTRWMDSNKTDHQELRRFRAEAAALLGIEKAPVPRGKEPSTKK